MRRALLSILGAAALAGALMVPVAAQSPSTSSSPGVIPEKLILGLVPSREADVLIESAQPLADYLSTTLGIPVASFVPSDYTGLVVAMGTGQAHIGAFGPFALVQAADEYGATIILQSVRRGSATYHTQWMTTDPATYCSDEVVTEVVQVGDPAADVTLSYCNGTLEATTGPVGEDALAKIPAGTTVSFVEQSSASGYIFPAVQLINAGIDPTSDITPLFAGNHDSSVIAICTGDASVGVSFDDARTLSTSLEGCPDVSTVVVFAYSQEIPNDGVAVAGDLDAGLKQRIADALIAYAGTEDGKAVLDSIYEIDEFAPADLTAFDVVREAAEKVGAPAE
jgi:phosphonate transport system substrate-binding protein